MMGTAWRILGSQMYRCIYLLAFVVLPTVVTGSGCVQKPRIIDLWAQLELDNCTEPDDFDFQPWQEVLSTYVKEGLVDYDKLVQEQSGLERFLCQLAWYGPGSREAMFKSPQQVLAYWINAYNALALAGAVGQYPCDGVYGQSGDLDSFEKNVLCKVDGAALTLREVRDQAYRAAAGDPRVLVALAGPAMGWAKLAGEPYMARSLDKQLRQAVQRVLGDRQLTKIEHETKTLKLPGAIYAAKDRYIELYRNTFDTDAGNLLNALMIFANRLQRQQLNTAIGYRMELIEFDSRLNKFEHPGGC